MFARHRIGAACLKNYRDIKAGAIVPRVNELYAQVEEWLETNEWAEMPAEFPPKTYLQKTSELNAWRKAEELKVAQNYSVILMRNGPYESQAKEGIRQTLLAQIDDKYNQDLSNLKAEYGV